MARFSSLLAPTLVLALAPLVLPPRPAGAQPAPHVAFDSEVYVEHIDYVGGAPVRHLDPATRLTRGDRVVTLVRWATHAGTGGFTVSNALPHALAFQRGARDDGEVSVDGGRNWGRLGSLRIAGRLASAEDVTNVRWRVSPAEARAGSGQIAYAGVVR